MILGMDWLEAFSPMKINRQHKSMYISYGRKQVLLQGTVLEVSECSVVRLFHIAEDVDTSGVQAIPPVVQDVIDQFTHLFAEPSSLPPRQACDHKIPLVQGAQPVAVRPYRYSPALKSEMESQVTDMLQSGLIQPSTSAFSSPVLLVRKKMVPGDFVWTTACSTPSPSRENFPYPSSTNCLMSCHMLVGSAALIYVLVSIRLD